MNSVCRQSCQFNICLPERKLTIVPHMGTQRSPQRQAAMLHIHRPDRLGRGFVWIQLRERRPNPIATQP